MMKLNVYATLVFALNLNTASASNETTPLSPSQIQDYLKPFKKPTQLQAKFKQIKIIKDLDITIRAEGDLRIKRASPELVSVFLHVLKPEPMKICIDQDRLIFIDLTSKKKTILKLAEISAADSSGLSHLVQLIKLDTKSMAAQFDIRAIAAKKLQFIPRIKKDFSFESANLDFDAQKNLRNIFVTETNKDTFELQFNAVKESRWEIKKDFTSDCNSSDL